MKDKVSISPCRPRLCNKECVWPSSEQCRCLSDLQQYTQMTHRGDAPKNKKYLTEKEKKNNHSIVDRCSQGRSIVRARSKNWLMMKGCLSLACGFYLSEILFIPFSPFMTSSIMSLMQSITEGLFSFFLFSLKITYLNKNQSGLFRFPPGFYVFIYLNMFPVKRRKGRL